MLNRLVFALVVFSMLLIIPTVALSFFEQKIDVPNEISEISEVNEVIPEKKNSCTTSSI